MKTTKPEQIGWTGLGIATACLLVTSFVFASSHREAPLIALDPVADSSDFYMFRSYEPGRDGFVTLIADYLPLQDPYGGPNYFSTDPNILYDIRIDNNGDAVEDLTFRFQFTNTFTPQTITVGTGAATRQVDVPVINVGSVVGPGFDPSALGQHRTYTVSVIRGPLGSPASTTPLTNAQSGSSTFGSPLDNIGEKTFPDYAGYANQFIVPINIPGCETGGKLFAGPREDPFYADLGAIFDLVHKPTPDGDRSGGTNTFANKNVTSFALEIPANCLTPGGDDVIGGWTTASRPRQRNVLSNPTLAQPDEQSGDLIQVSRLGNPLFNELVIGLPDKDRFNARHPSNDSAFVIYAQRPTYPTLLPFFFPGFNLSAPTNFPRNDLVDIFLQGISGLNRRTPPGPIADLLRLNPLIPPVTVAEQLNLGFFGGDDAGFPNGRRPADDVVDIVQRVLMGVGCHQGIGGCAPSHAPSGLIGFTDCVQRTATDFQNAFPYLNTPIPGSRTSSEPPPPPQLARNFQVTSIRGTNQVPPNASSGNGTCLFQINQTDTAFTGHCSHNFPNTFQVQINIGQPGQSPIVACIEINGPNENDFNCNVNHPRWQNNIPFDQFLQRIRNGEGYVNVLTSQFTAGAGVGFIEEVSDPLTAAPVDGEQRAVSRGRSGGR